MISISGPTASRSASISRADLVDIGQRRVVVGIGNEHRLQRPIALVDHLSGTLNQRLGLERLVDGAHVAESEMGVDLDPVAHLAAEQPPDRHDRAICRRCPTAPARCPTPPTCRSRRGARRSASSAPAPPARCRADRGRSKAERGPRRHRRRPWSSIRASLRPSRRGRPGRSRCARTPNCACRR